MSPPSQELILGPVQSPVCTFLVLGSGAPTNVPPVTPLGFIFKHTQMGSGVLAKGELFTTTVRNQTHPGVRRLPTSWVCLFVSSSPALKEHAVV